jgi:hypothetical protein
MVGEISNHHGRFDQAVDEASKATFELFNLKEDPGEQRNLASDRPQVYQDLKQRHLDWLRQYAR